MSNRGSDIHKRKENKGRVNRKQGRYATKLKAHPLLYSLTKLKNLASDMAVHKDKQRRKHKQEAKRSFVASCTS